jgi:hypothetical protein
MSYNIIIGYGNIGKRLFNILGEETIIISKSFKSNKYKVFEDISSSSSSSFKYFSFSKTESILLHLCLHPKGIKDFIKSLSNLDDHNILFLNYTIIFGNLFLQKFNFKNVYINNDNIIQTYENKFEFIFYHLLNGFFYKRRDFRIFF